MTEKFVEMKKVEVFGESLKTPFFQKRVFINPPLFLSYFFQEKSKRLFDSFWAIKKKLCIKFNRIFFIIML